eukprot:6181540-Pleurochrysis_carterae.AAC.2
MRASLLAATSKRPLGCHLKSEATVSLWHKNQDPDINEMVGAYMLARMWDEAIPNPAHFAGSS